MNRTVAGVTLVIECTVEFKLTNVYLCAIWWILVPHLQVCISLSVVLQKYAAMLGNVEKLEPGENETWKCCSLNIVGDTRSVCVRLRACMRVCVCVRVRVCQLNQIDLFPSW